MNNLYQFDCTDNFKTKLVASDKSHLKIIDNNNSFVIIFKDKILEYEN